MSSPARQAVDAAQEKLSIRAQPLLSEAQALLDKSAEEGRELNLEEVARFDAIYAEFCELEGNLNTERVNYMQDQLSAGTGRKTEPDHIKTELDHMPAKKPMATARVGLAPQKPSGDTFGFDSLGEQLQAMAHAGTPGGRPDQRLYGAVSDFGVTHTGADGGYLIAPAFYEDIMYAVATPESLLGRCMSIPTPANAIEVPVVETTPYDTAGPQLKSYAEGGTIDVDKPAIKSVTLTLHAVKGIISASNELIEDSPELLARYIQAEFVRRINHVVSYQILQGTGTGQARGILGTTCTVTVAKETNQAADTINFANVTNMWNRLSPDSRANAVWIVSPSAERQLYDLRFDPGVVEYGTPSNQAVATTPAYLGSLSGGAPGTLMGAPVLVHQAANELGDLGDIILADLSKYLVAIKAAGPRMDTSIHTYFDQDLSAFRYVMRWSGMPFMAAAVADRDGSATRSPFVALAERA